MDIDNIGSEELEELSYKYAEGTCTPLEEARLMNWYINLQKQELVLDEGNDDILHDLILSRIQESIRNDDVKQIRIKRKKIWSVAAAVLIGLFIYPFISDQNKPGKGELVQIKDVAPGRDNAILTTSDGQTIMLNGDTKGAIATVNGSKMIKTDSGSISVSAQSIVTEGQETAILASRYNSLRTPSGGQFRVILPDGTEVFLNAATVLSFPEQFTGKERRVMLTGEAFFKVTHNKNKPFKVITSKQEIEVLGTEFNINSYDNEPDAVTTLKTGSVRIVAEDSKRTLVPGQKAVTVAKGTLSVQDADLETELSWISGKIRFHNHPLPAILRQISRWYNLDINYQGVEPKLRLTGAIARQANLSEDLLPVLRMNNIEYKLESDGKRKILTIINNKNR